MRWPRSSELHSSQLPVFLTIACPDGTAITFEIEAGERTALLEGLDDVAMTLRHRLLIETWESRVATHQPWLQQVTSPD